MKLQFAEGLDVSTLDGDEVATALAQYLQVDETTVIKADFVEG